jgi:uncharacterized protein (DUF1501 family)
VFFPLSSILAGLRGNQPSPASTLSASKNAGWLYSGSPVIGPAIVNGLKARGFSDRTLMGAPPSDTNRNAFPALATAAGTMLKAPDGPRIAAMEIGGWDTHTAQANRLTGPLKQLDAGMVALKAALDDAWKNTVVLIMTEFGRTARLNGTGGTDHGTASVAFVLGGAIKGGRVLATWPGLAPGQLFDNRDLAPTTDLRSVAKGLLAGHLGLRGPVLDQVFPGSAAAAPMRGLVG